MYKLLIKYLFLHLSLWLTVEALRRGKRRKNTREIERKTRNVQQKNPERKKSREIHRLKTCEDHTQVMVRKI